MEADTVMIRQELRDLYSLCLGIGEVMLAELFARFMPNADMIRVTDLGTKIWLKNPKMGWINVRKEGPEVVSRFDE